MGDVEANSKVMDCPTCGDRQWHVKDNGVWRCTGHTTPIAAQPAPAAPESVLNYRPPSAQYKSAAAPGEVSQAFRAAADIEANTPITAAAPGEHDALVKRLDDASRYALNRQILGEARDAITALQRDLAAEKEITQAVRTDKTRVINERDAKAKELGEAYAIIDAVSKERDEYASQLSFRSDESDAMSRRLATERAALEAALGAQETK